MGTNAGPCTMLKLLQPHQNAFFHASLLACVFHSTTAANVATHSSPDVDSRIRGAMMGSLVADALTLGTHYASIYFICKYLDLAEAARANAEVGGDNASRSVAIGMVLGAWQGLEGIP